MIIKPTACKHARRIAIVTVLLALVLIAGCSLLPTVQPSAQQEPYQLKVVMLDVGQGDSILLESNGQFMLIDAGENDQGDNVVADLKAFGVTELAAVVGTHPHSDHIGGLDTVIKAFPVNAVYMPRITANTETYEDVLDAVQAKGLKITVPKPGDKLKFGQADLDFLWPATGYTSDNVNNYSIVIRASAGGQRILLCGDIEKNAEKSLLASGADVSCDVLKVAHHGSDTSSKSDFLSAAKPQTALISVGEDNSFKHPDKDVLKRLSGISAKIHRTDLNGNITVVVNNGTVSVQDAK